MFGSFSAGDSLRVYRLQRKGISLDLQRSLTQPSTPLWEAWLAFVSQQAMGQPTYVLDDLRDGEGFIQIRYRPHQAAADVVFLAPALEENHQATGAWARLLDGACLDAAERGIQRIFANLPDSGTEVDVFHQAGFTAYAGEEIYRLARPLSGSNSGPSLDVRPQRPEDWPAIQKLCVAITPQRVRQAEGGFAITTGKERNCQRYVLPGENGDDLSAVLSLCTGAQAHWLRLLVHPDASISVDDLIGWARSTLIAQPAHPVYCSLRQYEGGVRAALQAAGFEAFAKRVLVVKQTIAWSKTSVPELAPARAGSAEAVPPAYRINGDPEFQAPKGRLAATRVQDT